MRILPHIFRSNADIVAKLYRQELIFADVANDIRNNKIKASSALFNQVWTAHQLSNFEHDGKEYEWARIRQEIEIKKLKTDYHAVYQSTFLAGPQYNEFSNKNYLIPLNNGAISDATGLGSFFRGLKATTDGAIEFQFESAAGVPKFIFQEDLDVALILTFHKSGPYRPSLSVEPMEEAYSGFLWYLRQKVWKPSWLGKTLFGETMYAADFWAAQLMWRPEEFPADAQSIPNKEALTDFQKLAHEITHAGGHNPGHSYRLMVKLNAVRGSWHKEENSGAYVCLASDIEMGMDGSHTVHVRNPQTNLIEEKDSYLNDPRFFMGKKALLFTKNYNDIARFFPVFERARQLMGLICSLRELRDSFHFEPSAQLTKRMNEQYDRLTKGPELPLNRRLVIPRPGI